jgi:hypothetical protein
MSRKKVKSLLRPLPSVTVSTEISVLIPAKPEDSEGVAWTVADGYRRGKQVRVAQKGELTPERLAEIGGDDPTWVDFLCGVKLLRYLRSEGDDPLVHAQAWERIKPVLAPRPEEPDPKELLESYLLPALAVALAGVRLTFWHVKRDGAGNPQLLPGLYCPDLKTATAARWLLAPDIRVCPHCTKPFLAKRPKQMCDTDKCREAHRVARWRARKRFKEAAAA